MRLLVCSVLLLAAVACAAAAAEHAASTSTTTTTTTTTAVPTTATASSSSTTTTTPASPARSESATSKVKRQYVHHGDNATSFQLVSRQNGHTGGGRSEVAGGPHSMHHQHHQHHRPLAASRAPHGHPSRFRAQHAPPLTAEATTKPSENQVSSTENQRSAHHTSHSTTSVEQHIQPIHSAPAAQHESTNDNADHKENLHTIPETSFHVDIEHKPGNHDQYQQDNSNAHQEGHFSTPHTAFRTTIEHPITERKNNYNAVLGSQYHALPLTAEDAQVGGNLRNVFQQSHNTENNENLHQHSELSSKAGDFIRPSVYDFEVTEHPVVITKDGIQSGAFSSTGGSFTSSAEHQVSFENVVNHSEDIEKKSNTAEDFVSTSDNGYGQKLRNFKNKFNNNLPHENLAVIYKNEYENTGKPRQSFKEVFTTEDLKAVEGKRGIAEGHVALENQHKTSCIEKPSNDATKVNFQSYVSHPIQITKQNVVRPRPAEYLRQRMPLFNVRPKASPIGVYKPIAQVPVIGGDYKHQQIAATTQHNEIVPQNKPEHVQGGLKELIPITLIPSKPQGFRLNPHHIPGYQKVPHHPVIPYGAQPHLPVRPLVKPVYPVPLQPYRYVPLPVHPSYPNFVPGFKPKPLVTVPTLKDQTSLKNPKFVYLPTGVYTGKLQENVVVTRPVLLNHEVHPQEQQDNKNLYEALVRQKINFQEPSRESVVKPVTEPASPYEPLKHTAAIFPDHPKPTSHQSYTFVYPSRQLSHQAHVQHGQDAVIPVTESGHDVPPPTTHFTFQPADAVTGPREAKSLAHRAGSRGDVPARHRSLVFPALSSPAEELFAAGSSASSVSTAQGSNGWKPILRPRDFAARSSDGAAAAAAAAAAAGQRYHGDDDSDEVDVEDGVDDACVEASAPRPATAPAPVEATVDAPAPAPVPHSTALAPAS